MSSNESIFDNDPVSVPKNFPYIKIEQGCITPTAMESIVASKIRIRSPKVENRNSCIMDTEGCFSFFGDYIWNN